MAHQLKKCFMQYACKILEEFSPYSKIDTQNTFENSIPLFFLPRTPH